MISVSGGRVCRDRDGAARLVALLLRLELAAAGLAARLGRSMVCLRRVDVDALASSSADPPVNRDDTLDVTADTTPVLVASVAVDRDAPRREDMP
jgi:hypothetical protein